MDFLKWLMKASFILALMFLGLDTESDKDDGETDHAEKSSSVHQVLNLH